MDRHTRYLAAPNQRQEENRTRNEASELEDSVEVVEVGDHSCDIQTYDGDNHQQPQRSSNCNSCSSHKPFPQDHDRGLSDPPSTGRSSSGHIHSGETRKISPVNKFLPDMLNAWADPKLND